MLCGINKTKKPYNLFPANLSQFQDFSRKLPNLVKIHNAYIVYLLSFGTRFSTHLKYFCKQIKEASDSPSKEVSNKTSAY